MIPNLTNDGNPIQITETSRNESMEASGLKTTTVQNKDVNSALKYHQAGDTNKTSKAGAVVLKPANETIWGSSEVDNRHAVADMSHHSIFDNLHSNNNQEGFVNVAIAQTNINPLE